jgi:hypothetical protein
MCSPGLFIGVGALGLWLSRNYPVGTALRMGTGCVPQLLCFLSGPGPSSWCRACARPTARPSDGGARARLWPIAVVTSSLVVFGLPRTAGLVVPVCC